MKENRQDPANWPELFVSLYDRLTGSNAEIAYAFDDLKIDIPNGTSESSPHAHWKLNGTMRISSSAKTV